MLNGLFSCLTHLAAFSISALQAIDAPDNPVVDVQDQTTQGVPDEAVARPLERIVVPELTPVTIEILDGLGSKISRSLDTFRIRLAEPIIVDDREVVPAGSVGLGEVVHAKKAGGMGAAGELVLAARWIEHGGKRVLLRSMTLDGGQTGKSATDEVGKLNVAAAATVPLISLAGYLISGGNIEVPAGSLASAKVKADFEIATDGAAPPDSANVEPVDHSVGEDSDTIQNPVSGEKGE